MAPVRYTLESFEDVAGYPGKIFYVLHQYPGTGCRQVPFLAIDKTEEGFKIRELEQHPVEEFNDGTYKFHWPRDPRLQCSNDEAEELVSSETSPPTIDTSSIPTIQDVKSISKDFYQKNKHEAEELVSSETSPPAIDTSSIPIIQDVKSICEDFYQKNKPAQTLLITKDGHSMVKKEADAPVINFESNSTISTLPLSSRVIKESSIPDEFVNSPINQNAGTSKTALALTVDGSVVTKNSGSTVGSGDTKVGDETNISTKTNDQNATIPRNVLPACFNDIVASNKSGCAVSFDTKVDNIPNNPTKTKNQNASTSRLVMLGLHDDHVASKNTGSSVSVDTMVSDISNRATKALSQNAPSKIVLPASLDDNVAPRRTGSPVSLSKNVEDLQNKSVKTLSENASSTSRSVMPGFHDDSVTSKNTGSTVSVDTTASDISSRATKALNQNACSSKIVLPASLDDNVAPRRTGSPVSLSKNVEDVQNKAVKTLSENANNTSRSVMPGFHDDSVASKNTERTVSVDTTTSDISSRATKAPNQNASTSRIVLPASLDDNVAPRRTGSPVSPSKNVDDVHSKSVKTLSENASSSSRSVLPGFHDNSLASKNTGSTVSVDTTASDIPSEATKVLNQNASTSRIVLPASLNDSVVPRRTGSPVALSKNVDVRNKFAKTVSENASTSRSVTLGLHEDSVESKKNGSTVSVDTTVSKATKALNQDASTSNILLPDSHNDSVASRRTGSPVCPSKKVEDVTKKCENIEDQNASTSRTELQVTFKDNEPPKKNDSAVPVYTVPNESTKTVARNSLLDMLTVGPGVRDKTTEPEPVGLSRPFIPCSTDSPVASFNNTVLESPSVTSALEANKLTSRVAAKSENHTVSDRETCMKSSLNSVTRSSELNVAPTDDKELEGMSSTSVPTCAKMDSSPVKLGQTKAVTEEVTPCDKDRVVKEISSLVNKILSERVKSSNQSTEYSHNPADTDIQTPAAVQKTPESDKARKEPSPVKLDNISEESPHKNVVKEITCIVNDLISDHVKSNDQIHELSTRKIGAICQPTTVDGKSFSQSTSDCGPKFGSSMGNLQSGRSKVHKDCSTKGRELLDKHDMDQTDLKEKYNLNKSKEIPCLPRIAEKELSDVDNLITKAKNFVKLKRIEFLENKPVEDWLAKKEKSTKESSAEPGKSELKHKQRTPKSPSVERLDEHKSEKSGKKSVSSVPKSHYSGDTLSKGADNALVSRRISSEPPLRSSIIGNRPCGVESQSRSNDSTSDVSECPVRSSEKTDSDLVKGTCDVYNFESDNVKVVSKQKTILRRRNTVDGSENKPKGRRRPVSAKYSPYNLQRYRKELEKNRPTKKSIPLKAADTQNPGEKPNDDGGSTTGGSYSCPGSPVSKTKKSSIEDIFNLRAILTDDSSACNYSDITLKGPVQVASNAPLNKPMGSPSGTKNDNLRPTLKDKTVRKTKDEQFFFLMRKKRINARLSKGDDNAKDSRKNSDEAPQNSDSNLTNYAEDLLERALESESGSTSPVEAALPKTSKHYEDTKKKERKNKCSALMKERHFASETTVDIVVDTEGSSANIIPETPKVGESSKHSPPVLGMHKLPAVVSCRGTQLKPVPLKKIMKNDSGLTTNKIEVKREEDNKTPSTDLLKKLDDAKELPKPSDIESNDKAQDEQLGNKSVKSLKTDCSQSKISPLLETPKLQLALKRQKRLDSPPTTSTVKDSSSTKVTKPTLLNKDVTVSPSEYPAAKRVGDKLKKDIKKGIDVSKSPEKEKSKANLVDKTEIKNNTKPPKSSSKLDISKKSSLISTLGNKHANMEKQSPKPGDGSKEDPPALEVGVVQAKKSLVECLPSPSLKAFESCVDEGSTVCAESSTAIDDTPTIIDKVTVSNSLSNVPPLGSQVLSDPTDSFPTTESRKKLLHQLNTTITENKLLLSLNDSSNNPKAQARLLGPVSIGSKDLIEDKIKTVVEDIVKVKIEMNEIFEDDTAPSAREMTVSTESAAEPIGALVSAVTAPVIPANTSDFTVPQPTVSDASGEKSGTKDVVREDHILEDKQNVSGIRGNNIDKPSKQWNLNATVPTIKASLSESSASKDKLISSKECDINSCSNDGKSKGSSSLDLVSETPVVTAEISQKNKNQKESMAEEVTELSSGCDSPAPNIQADEDLVEISSQESVEVEIVEVDGFSSNSQRNGMSSSRKLRKRRRVIVDEHVPTIAALTRNRRTHGNKLALLRKLVARRFSVELFSAKSKSWSAVKLNCDHKHVSTNNVIDVEAPCTVATKLPSDASNTAIEMTKPKDNKSKDGVTIPEVIKPDVQPSFPETTKPVVDGSETEVIKPGYKVTKSDITNDVFEATESEVVKPVVLVTEPDIINPPVEVKVTESKVIKPEGEVPDPEISQPSMEVEEDPLSQPTDVIISGGDNSERLDIPQSIPFLEDDEYPPKRDGFGCIVSDSGPHPLFMPKPIEMPKPLITLRNRTRHEDDGIIEITDTNNSSGIRSRSSSKRLTTESSEQSKQKRLCAIPAPKLPESVTHRPVAAKDKIPPTVGPEMPQPILEFRSSPTQLARVEQIEETDPSIIGPSSSTSIPKRETSLSKKLTQRYFSAFKRNYRTFKTFKYNSYRARLGEHCLNNDEDLSPHSGNSTTTRRVSVVIFPSEDGRVPPQSRSKHCGLEGKKKKKKKKPKPNLGFHETYDIACQEGAPSTSQSDIVAQEIRHKGTSRMDRRRLGVWRREVRVKKVRLDSQSVRSEEGDQSSVEGEHGQSSRHKSPQNKDATDNCSTSSRGDRLGIRRSRWVEKSSRNENRHKYGSRYSPSQLSESGVSCIHRTDTSQVASFEKPLNPSSSGDGDHCLENAPPDPSLTLSAAASRSPPERWERPNSKRIYKVDREEAAWRDHLEDGRRFLGRRLKRFSHQEPSASHSSQSSPGSRRHSTPSSIDGQSPATTGKKLRSSSHHAKGLSDVPTGSIPVQKERPSSRGKGVGPGHRKGDRRKTEGGHPRQLRSTAHMSRSGLIRKGDI